MITQISLEHFKCFERLKLPLAPLTLLTGLNASGKSTVIQALTLLHQTIAESPNSASLVLNGKMLQLGSADELVDKVTGRNQFAIGVQNDQVNVRWRMEAVPNSMVAQIEIVQWDEDAEGQETLAKVSHTPLYRLIPNNQKDNPLFQTLIETLQSLTYVSADRIGPRETYPASSSEQQQGVGARGEYTPWFISENEDLEIPESMCVAGTPPLLKRQVEAWLGTFFPGSAIEIEPLARTSMLVMRLRTSNATQYHRPANVGYGLSHILPVITACLGAVGFVSNESAVAPLVLIENPELHLHPAGQSAMGVFLARAAAAGAQLIVETHSDHVINGVRRAVKGIDGAPILTPEQVAIHFFQPRDDTGIEPPKAVGAGHSHIEGRKEPAPAGRPQVISPRIDRNGSLDSWPEGFFDQIDRDTATLIDW